MKFLKIILILLVPAMGLVGCEKRTCGPKDPNASTSTGTDAPQTGAKLSESASNSGNTDLVGSGDDDRDGGDKKPKKTR